MQVPFPNTLERRPNLVMLGFLNNPSITGYQILVSDTLDGAYGNFNGVVANPATPGVAFSRIQRGEVRVTSTIQRRGNILTSDTTRGQTRIIYDPNELIGKVASAPFDGQVAFVRVQVTTVAQPAFPIPDNTTMSDILIVPPYGFNSVPRPSIQVYGTAPDLGASAVLGKPAPSESMIFHVPNFGDAMDIRNHGPGALYFSVGKGLPLAMIAEDQHLSLPSGMKDELIFCASGNNPKFSAVISTVAGER